MGLIIFTIVLYVSYYAFFRNTTTWPKSEYAENRHYIFNNNIAQYSSYLIKDVDSDDVFVYRIETIIIRSKFLSSKDEYICVLKYNQTQEIIEIKAHRLVVLQYNESKKIIFKLNLKNFKTYLNNSNNFNLNQILLAVILKEDYNRNISIPELNKKFLEKFESNSTVEFPYSMINFQKPTLVNAFNQRLKSVGLCIQNVYAVASFLLFKNWVDYHLLFGIGEIMFYDAIDNKLLKFVQENYSNEKRLNVVSVAEIDSLFEENNLFVQFSSKQYSSKLRRCLSNYIVRRFKYSRIIRNRAGQIHTNDCFTILRTKHEFIAHYDLDEILIPRKISNKKTHSKINYSCNRSQQICSLKSFKNNNFENHFYEYLNSLIESERKGRDREKLLSIDFRRTLILKPNQEIEASVVDGLNRIVNTINSKQNFSFPLELLIKLDKNDTGGYKFMIDKTNVHHVQYLHNTYKNFISCAYDKYFNKSIDEDKIVDTSFVRYLYFVTEYEFKNKNFKKIHYYKNVYGIFTHWATDYENDTWTFIPSPANGHYLHHFREQYKLVKEITTDSIKLLSIDFDHLNYLLKEYTNFCY